MYLERTSKRTTLTMSLWRTRHSKTMENHLMVSCMGLDLYASTER